MTYKLWARSDVFRSTKGEIVLSFIPDFHVSSAQNSRITFKIHWKNDIKEVKAERENRKYKISSLRFKH